MDRLENIKLSKKEAYQLIKKSFFSSGGEAVICRTDNSNTLYKIFFKGNMYNVVTMGENKLRKIERIHQMKLDGCIKPLRTISMNGRLIGYEMSYDPDDLRYYPTIIRRAETISQLKETKRLLEYFCSKGVIYGDIAFRNILLNRKTGQIKFCDVDNACVCQYPMDLIPPRLRDYYDVCGLDERVHPYMHNVLTLEAFNMNFSAHDNKKIETEFKKKTIPIIESMREPANFQGEYIIQYVKKRR